MESTNLVVNIVVVRIVACKPLQRVKREGVSAVVVDGLEGGKCKQEHGLARRHASQPLGDDSTTRIENEALDGVVERSAVRIRYIHLVVKGVNGLE